MDTGPLYKPNFTRESIKNINDIFGYEFFKMPKEQGGDKSSRATLPEYEKQSEAAKTENKSVEMWSNGAETDKSTPTSESNGEQSSNEWDNFFIESKDIKP